MPTPRTILLAVICLICVLLSNRQMAQADPLPALPLKERQSWAAVGQVNSAGFRSKAACTGTLIAPDLVVTAAHCASGHRHFVAGWDRGSFVAHRQSRDPVLHPAYTTAQGNQRFNYDIAVLRLDTPVPAHTVAPVPLNDQSALRSGDLSVLGYHRKRPHVLNGRHDCLGRPDVRRSMLILDCEVISGNSGGPVLARTPDGWSLVAVVVGRIEVDPPRALAVPVNDWLLTHWRAALARAQAR